MESVEKYGCETQAAVTSQRGACALSPFCFFLAVTVQQAVEAVNRGLAVMFLAQLLSER